MSDVAMLSEEFPDAREAITPAASAAGTMPTSLAGRETCIGALDTSHGTLDTSAGTLDTSAETVDTSLGPVDASTRGFRTSLNRVETSMDVSDDDTSSSSAVVNTTAAISTVSTIPDKYGFMHVDGDEVHYEEEKLPMKMLRQREHKWLEMLQHWDYFMTNNFKKVRSRCRKGIPTSLRARAWQHLCGGQYLLQKHPGAYEKLLRTPLDEQVGDEIGRDLHRQFPMHEMFMRKGGQGQEELMKILRAYAAYNPADGYSQAQAPLAAVLLMHMPAEQAFWCLVSICREYLPGYYGPGLERVQLDGDILQGLVKRVAPHVYRHLKKQKVDPALYMVEWFMCIFSRTLPWASVLRVWDMFFCEGVKVMFRVALVLIRYTLGRRGILKQCPTMYETVELLRTPPPEIMHETVLVHQIMKLDLDEDSMTREHHKQLKKRKKAEKQRQKELEQRERAKQKQQQPQQPASSSAVS